MQLRNKRVLVTGSSGVIGRVLVRRLVEFSSKILAVDIVSEPRPATGVQYFTHDLAKGTPQSVVDFVPEVVFHLAATFERTVESPGYWKTVFENDVLASHRLLEAAERMKSLEVFAFASSYLNYDPTLYLDVAEIRSLNEADRLLPRNMVGLSKYYVDRELDFLRNTGASYRTVSARIFRVYGRGSRDVISRWVRAGLGGEVLLAFGLKSRFDYIYADDVAEGLARLAEVESASGEVNLGSGTSRSIAEVLEILRSQIPRIKVEVGAEQSPVESSGADMTRFQQWTGWLPPTTLEDGIGNIVKFETERLRDLQ
jgi:nucleoside-diphosphate-sugar epimerase